MTYKFLSLLLTISISFLAQAQNGSSRKVLVELFGVGHHAFTDEVLDTLDLNAGKVVLVNYIGHLPVFVPNYWPTGMDRYVDKLTLGPYSNVRSSYLVLNGNNYNSDSLARVYGLRNLSSAQLDAEVARPSPFNLSVRHTFNSTYDSVIIDIDIECTTNVQGRNLVLFVTPVQKYRTLDAGTIGISRRGYAMNANWSVSPDTGKFILHNSWTVGQSARFRVKSAINSFSDLNELAVVAHIQDVSSLEVHQAAISEPPPIRLGNVELTPSTLYDANNICNNRITPMVVIRNLGPDTLRQVKVTAVINSYHYLYNQNLIGDWTGELATGEYATFNFPATVLHPNRRYVINYKLNSANGLPDLSRIDDLTDFIQLTRMNWLADRDTLDCDFSLSPVEYYGVASGEGVSNGPYLVTRTVELLYFNPNLQDEYSQRANYFYPRPVSLFGRDSSAQIEFKFVSKPSLDRDWRTNILYILSDSTKTDTFALQATTDCGLNWTTLWQKSGRELMTTSFSDTSELAERHWRTVKASLAPVVGRIAHFRFVNLSHGMAQVYLDDIRIRPVPVVPPHTYTPSPYPNPTNGLLHLDLEFTGAGNSVQTSMFDALGRQVIGEVRHTLPAGLTTLSVDMSVLGNGYYYLVVNMPDGSKKSWPVIKL